MAVDAGLIEIVKARVSLDTLAHPAYLAAPIAEKLIAKTNVTGLSHIAALATMTAPVVETSVEFSTLSHQRILGGFEQVVRVSISEPEIQETLSGFNSVTVTTVEGSLPNKFTTSVIKNSDFTLTLITEHDLVGQVVALQISSGFQETTSVYSILGSKKLVQAEPVSETLTVDALLQGELEPVIIDVGFSTAATTSVNLLVNKLVVGDFTLASKSASTVGTAKQIQKGITSFISVSYEIEAGIFLGVVTVSCLRSSYAAAIDMVSKALCNVSLTSVCVSSVALKTVCIAEAAPQISTIVPEVILTSRTTACQQNCY